MSTNALDELALAITNAGYEWTPEMRRAYEKGIRQDKLPKLGAEIVSEDWINALKKGLVGIKEKNT